MVRELEVGTADARLTTTQRILILCLLRYVRERRMSKAHVTVAMIGLSGGAVIVLLAKGDVTGKLCTNQCHNI